MSKSLKLSIALVVAAVVVVLGVAWLTGEDTETDTVASSASTTTPGGGNAAIVGPTVATVSREDRLVRPDSPRLTTGTKATFVEFLDFECESCGAIYPTIEDLKKTYGDRVSFVVRHMPLHTSSVNAAKAAEAAGAQGRFEDMYDVLFQRQDEWGHQKTPEEARFFRYAEELGLDMTRFRADYADPATAVRIAQSKADGQALGVSQTPTMFLDGKRLQPKSLDDFVRALDAAVAG